MPLAKEVVLKITLNQSGVASLDGPLENKILCLGLLEIAKDIVKQYKPPIIQPVTINLAGEKPRSAR